MEKAPPTATNPSEKSSNHEANKNSFQYGSGEGSPGKLTLLKMPSMHSNDISMEEPADPSQHSEVPSPLLPI